MAISISLLALAFVIVGLLLYFWAKNPKWQEVGRILFFCGALAIAFAAGAASFKIG